MEPDRLEWIERLYHAQLEGANPERLDRLRQFVPHFSVGKTGTEKCGTEKYGWMLYRVVHYGRNDDQSRQNKDTESTRSAANPQNRFANLKLHFRQALHRFT